jgi:hypothetical protein
MAFGRFRSLLHISNDAVGRYGTSRRDERLRLIHKKT